MSKHIDLIAIAFLLIAFAFAARFHDALRAGKAQQRFLELRQVRPVLTSPPCPPAMPRLARLPSVHS
jgi:hypothetical protein